MSIAFISDLHLDASRPDLFAALAAWLKRQLHAPDEVSALYILGDLFEVWVGDDEDDPAIIAIVDLLAEFGAQRPLFLCHGNRDFLMGPALCERLHAQLLPEVSVQDLHGERTLVLHGDSLCIDDSAYMAARQMFRNPAWQEQILSQPIAARRELAATLRAQSQAANANKAAGIMDVNSAEVERVLQEHGCQRMIHGHTHRPGTHRWTAVTNGSDYERVVLGDWDRYAWIYLLDKDGGNLTRLPIHPAATT